MGRDLQLDLGHPTAETVFADICVGGALDGQHHEEPRDRKVFQAVMRPTWTATRPPTASPLTSDSFSYSLTTYERRVFHTSTKNIAYWVARPMTDADAFERLLATYVEVRGALDRITEEAHGQG